MYTYTRPLDSVSSAGGDGGALQKGSHRRTRPFGTHCPGTRARNRHPPCLTSRPRPSRATPLPPQSTDERGPAPGGGDGSRGREEAAALNGCRAGRGGAGGARTGPLAGAGPVAVGARVEDGLDFGGSGGWGWIGPLCSAGCGGGRGRGLDAGVRLLLPVPALRGGLRGAAAAVEGRGAG